MFSLMPLLNISCLLVLRSKVHLQTLYMIPYTAYNDKELSRFVHMNLAATDYFIITRYILFHKMF